MPRLLLNNNSEQLFINDSSFRVAAKTISRPQILQDNQILLLAKQVKEHQQTIHQLISELTEKEDELEDLCEILYASSDPILITSADIKIIFVNAAWEKLTGYTLKEVKGQNPRILQSGKTPPHVYKAMWKALSNNLPFTTEETIDKRKDGSLYQIHSAIFPVLKNDKVIYYVQLQHDITDRIKREQILKFQGQIIQNMAEGVCLVRISDEKIVYTNPKFDSMFGYNSGELYGEHVSIVNYAKNKKSATDISKKIIKNLKKYGEATYEVQNVKKDGTSFWSNATTSEFNHPEYGKVWIAVHQDITEKKQLEELRKEFLSAAAHELKTPLTVIKLITQQHLRKIRNKSTNGISLKECELMNSEINRLTGLVDDILDSSRFETGKLFFDFQIINLSEQIKTTIQKMEVYGNSHKIVLKDLPSEMYIKADASRIEQVFLNLLSNAVKYSPENSTITVAAQKKADEIIISVTDQGDGITKEKQKMIFDKYYQIKAREQKGFGLGLYISKEIIDRHNGKIWIESRKGKGSTFYVSLPIKIN